MKYNEMKEMTTKEWDGNPFMAYVADDNTDAEVDKTNIAHIVGFVNGLWLGCTHWMHAYPIEWNKPQPKRMTNRQLAKWLAQGNGEYSNATGCGAYQNCGYAKDKANDEVPSVIRVRTWDSEEWVEPTVDLLKEDK